MDRSADDSLLAAYARWRSSPLSEITERLERELLLELAQPLAGRRVLDVGCGDGTYAIAAAALGAKATGVDASPHELAAARARAAQCGADVRFVAGDARRLPFADASFDVVVAATVLCFVREPALVFGELARVVAPGGRLVIGELNRYSLWALWRRLRAWLGSAHWRAAHFRSARELAALATHAGLRVEGIRGAIFFPPLTLAARAMAPVDHRLGRRTTFGGAFVALQTLRNDQRGTVNGIGR